MRLLNVHTLKLQEYMGEGDRPRYAILSHTWGDNEETFNDLQRDPEFLPKSPKILGFCKVARNCDFDWVWIDTYCIDKSSSAELSEAINSMFRWYEASDMCFAYLSDVKVKPRSSSLEHASSPNDDVRLRDAIRNSRWFTRGWTLQELLAPKHVAFFNSDWELMGEVGGRVRINPMTQLVSDITRVPMKQLSEDRGFERPSSFARRLSWAAGRSTTRLEDEAYCLLGLLGINMPLLYGEGRGAFRRLLEEVLKVSTDQSILAWGYQGQNMQRLDCGCLPWSPSVFDGCGTTCEQLVKLPSPGNTPNNNGTGPWAPGGIFDHSMMTNRGILITVPLLEVIIPSSRCTTYLGVLNCKDSDTQGDHHIAIVLRRDSERSNDFLRARGRAPMRVPLSVLPAAKPQLLYLSLGADRILAPRIELPGIMFEGFPFTGRADSEDDTIVRTRLSGVYPCTCEPIWEVPGDALGHYHSGHSWDDPFVGEHTIYAQYTTTSGLQLAVRLRFVIEAYHFPPFIFSATCEIAKLNDHHDLLFDLIPCEFPSPAQPSWGSEFLIDPDIVCKVSLSRDFGDNRVKMVKIQAGPSSREAGPS